MYLTITHIVHIAYISFIRNTKTTDSNFFVFGQLLLI